MLGFIIAECSECGQCYFANDEETVRRKFSQHICVQDWTDEELWQWVEQFLQSHQADKGVDIHGKGEAPAAGEGSEIPKPQALKSPSLPPKMRAMTIARRFVGPPEGGE